MKYLLTIILIALCGCEPEKTETFEQRKQRYLVTVKMLFDKAAEAKTVNPEDPIAVFRYRNQAAYDRKEIK